MQEEIRLHLFTRCLMTSGISDAVLHSLRHSQVSVAEEDGKVPTQPGCFSSSAHGCVFSRPSAFPRTKRSSSQQRDEGSDDNRHRNILLSDLRQMLDLEIESSNTELTSSGRAGGGFKHSWRSCELNGENRNICTAYCIITIRTQAKIELTIRSVFLSAKTLKIHRRVCRFAKLPPNVPTQLRSLFSFLKKER